MAKKAMVLDTSTGRLKQSSADFTEESDVATVAAANKIPRADAGGKIDSDWVPLLDIASLPVAADGEVSNTKVVRADDSRFSDPDVGGDISGTALSAVVIKIQGRSVANVSPADGYALLWNSTLNRWEPAAVSSGGGSNATQLQGYDIATSAPTTGDALVWNGSAWSPGDAGGGGSTPAANLILFERYT